jgi:thiol:disulfide interchange protein DsbA
VQRRHFSALAAASLGLGLAPLARAQGAPVEGKEYRRLSPSVTPSTPAGTVDVVEFFSFACPHCYAFEPTLETWLAHRPAVMHFHRIPVPFLFNSANFQPLYFTLEALNLTDTLQIKVFNAVHQEHQRLDSPEAIAAFATKNGLDAARFMSTFNSFGVRTKVQQANQLVQALGVNEVPMLVVQGRFATSLAQAQGATQALAVVDYLVAQVHAGR